MAAKVLVTGRTFAVRDELREAGGQWDAVRKGWVIDSAAWEEIRSTWTPTYSRRLAHALDAIKAEAIQ